MQRLRALSAALWIAGGAVALRLALPYGFANYDTLYSLVWGQQLARGQTPTYNVALAPTPHPLAEGLGLVLSVLGAGATLTVVVALAYLALAALAYLVYRLGTEWFSWPVGVAAAALIISRYEVLSYGVRAYVDIPYVVIVLAALLVETRRRRAGWPVIALLALAGLLRPEAWLFAGVYWLYLALARRSRRELAWLAALVLVAPLIWVLSDLAITGNLLWSLSHTRSTAATLKRPTGLLEFPYTGARRLGEVLGPDGLVAAAIGGVLSLWLTRSRALLGFAVGVVAIVAFLIVASSGLPIDDRYAFLPAALLAICARRRPVRLAIAAARAPAATAVAARRGRDRGRDRRVRQLERRPVARDVHQHGAQQAEPERPAANPERPRRARRPARDHDPLRTDRGPLPHADPAARAAPAHQPSEHRAAGDHARHVCRGGDSGGVASLPAGSERPGRSTTRCRLASS